MATIFAYNLFDFAPHKNFVGPFAYYVEKHAFFRFLQNSICEAVTQLFVELMIPLKTICQAHSAVELCRVYFDPVEYFDLANQIVDFDIVGMVGIFKQDDGVSG